MLVADETTTIIPKLNEIMGTVNVQELVELALRDHSLTVTPRAPGAYNLKPLEALQKPKYELDSNAFLYRTIIPYSVKEEDFKRVAELQLVLGIRELAKLTDIKAAELITIRRPGQTEDYVRELENMTGYELRIYLMRELPKNKQKTKNNENEEK
jgi:hypothetical protein